MSKKRFYRRTLLKLSLAKKNAAEKVSMGRNVCTSMSGSAYFVGQAAMILELADATDLLEDANVKALNKGIEEKAYLAFYEAEWNRVMARIGFTVQSIADVDYTQSPIIILSAGLQVRNGRSRNPVPEAPNVVARFNETPGTAKLLIKGGRYAKSYLIYASENMADPASWILVGFSVKRKYIATGLKSSTRYYFKVVPYGIKGQGPAGTIASMVAA